MCVVELLLHNMEDISSLASKFDLDMNEVRSGVETKPQSAPSSNANPLPPDEGNGISSAPTRRPSRSGVKYTEKADEVEITPVKSISPVNLDKALSVHASPSSPTKTFISSFGEKITRVEGEEEAFFNKLYEQGKKKHRVGGDSSGGGDPEIVADLLTNKRSVVRKSAAEQSEYMQRLYSKGSKASSPRLEDEIDENNSVSSSNSRPKPTASEQEKATSRLYERGRKAAPDASGGDSTDDDSRSRVGSVRAAAQGKAMQRLYERGRRAPKEPSAEPVARSKGSSHSQAEATNRLYERGRRAAPKPESVPEDDRPRPVLVRPKASVQSEQMHRLYQGGGGRKKAKAQGREQDVVSDSASYVPPRHLSVDPPRVDKYGRARQSKPKGVVQEPDHPALDPNSAYAYNMERFGAKSGSDVYNHDGYYDGSEAIVYDVHKKTLQAALDHSTRIIQEQFGSGGSGKPKSVVKKGGESPKKKTKKQGQKLKSPSKSAAVGSPGGVGINTDNPNDDVVDFHALDANVAAISDERDLSQMISKLLYKCDTTLADSYNNVVVSKRGAPGDKMSENDSLQQSRLVRALSSQQYNAAMDEALMNRDLNKLKVLLADRPMAIPLGTTEVDITSNAEFELRAPQSQALAPVNAPADSDADLALRYKLAMAEGGYRSLVPQSNVEALERSPIFKDTYGVKALLAPYVNKTFPDPNEVALEVQERLEVEGEKDRALSRRLKEARRGQKAGRAEPPSGLFLTAAEEDGDSSSSESEQHRRSGGQDQERLRLEYAPVIVPLSPGSDLSDDETSLTFPHPPVVEATKQQHFRKIVVSSSNTNLKKVRRRSSRLVPGEHSNMSDSESEGSERVIEVDRYPASTALIRRSIDGQVIPEESASPKKKRKKRKIAQADNSAVRDLREPVPESEEELSPSPRKGKGKRAGGKGDATSDVKSMVSDFYQNMARRQSRSDPADGGEPNTQSGGDNEKGRKPRHIPHSRNEKGALPQDPVRAAELSRRREEKERDRFSKIEFYALQRQMKQQRENQERAELLENRQEAERLAKAKGQNGRKQAPVPPQRPAKRPPGRPKPKPTLKPVPVSARRPGQSKAPGKPPAAKRRSSNSNNNAVPQRPHYRQGVGDRARDPAADLNANMFMLFPPQLMAAASTVEPTPEVDQYAFPAGFPQPKMPLFRPPGESHQPQVHGNSPRRHQHPQEFDNLEPLQNVVSQPPQGQQLLAPTRPPEGPDPRKDQPFQKLRGLYAAAETQAQGQGDNNRSSLMGAPSSAPADPIQHPGMFAYGSTGGRHHSPPQLFASLSNAKSLGPTQPQSQSQPQGASPLRVGQKAYVSKFASPGLQQPAAVAKMYLADSTKSPVPAPGSQQESYSFEMFRPSEQQQVPAPAIVPEEPAFIPVEPLRVDSLRKYGNPMLQMQPQALPYRRSKQTKEPLKSPYIAVQNRPPNPSHAKYSADDLLAEPIHESV